MSIVKIPEHQLDLTNITARIDTAQNDLAVLGDQVSVIESKIPNDASETNPLATKGQVEAVSSDLTDLENKTAEIESKISETATSTNKLIDAEFLASELAKKQDTGDYATKTDVNNLADDLSTVTNQVGEQGEAINGLNSAVTNLSNNKADKADSLFGYGITDAYTKEEVNGLVSSAFHYKGSKASVLELPKEGNIIGDVWNVLDTGANYAWTGKEWDKLSETVDLSGYYTKDEVNNKFSTKSDVNAHITNTNNPHNVTKAQIGLGNVDNTADVDKPISTLQQSAIDLKADKSDTYTKTEVDNQLSTKANADEVYTKTEVDTFIAEQETNITTVKNDLAGLGDQVSVIESKIPAEASDTNQLATKEEVSLKADKTELTSLATKEDIALKADKTEVALKADKTELESLATKEEVALKQDKLSAGKNITIVNNIISATGGGSGFDFEGTKVEFDAAVAAGTITADSVSLITDDVDGANVATKAELQAVDRSKADTALSNVLANIDYVVESKFPTADDPSWYRVYKSGWVEQGGYWKPSSIKNWETITFLKSFANTNYYVNVFQSDLTNTGSSDTQYYNSVKSFNRKATSFQVATGLNEKPSYCWEAKGMGAN